MRNDNKLVAVIGGCLVLTIGITFGILFGLLASTSPSGQKASSVARTAAAGMAGGLRKKLGRHGGGGGPLEVNQLVVNNNVYTTGGGGATTKQRAVAPPPADDDDDTTAEDHGAPNKIVHNNEKKFLKHTMNSFNDESDPFPYYPNPDDDKGYYVSQTGMYILKTYDFTKWTAKGGERFTEYKFGDSPYQYVEGESDELARSRRYHVKQAMVHAWHGYEAHAMGKDELLPQSGRGNNKWGGMGMTLVDALDTLWLMELKDEFSRARDWVATTLQHDLNTPVSTFETTIRSLGGLLSAYDWSGDDIFLTQAKDLGQRLFKAFDPNHPGALPHGQINLANGGASNIGWTANSVILSEITTIQLEFRYLARLSGIKDYKTKTEHVFEVLHAMKAPNGLYPYFLKQGGKDGALPTFVNQKITFGAMSDSCYEYMLKLWLQGGKTEPLYREMYDTSIQGMHDELVSVSTPSGLVFLADKNSGRMDYKMDHLVCFMGGLLALGAYTDPLGLESDRAQRDLKTAKVRT